MLIQTLAAAAGDTAPQVDFGFEAAMEQGGVIAWAIFGILVIMSIGSIDKVAGPVGEALIMTAIGLLVAVPAVFAYNWLQNRNKRIAELLSAFSTDILAYINSRGAVKPAVATRTTAQPTARPATATATKA